LLKVGRVELTLQKIFLLTIREIYLFLRNLLGLIFHPYKTLRTISREKDFSQVILLSSWPLPLWFGLGTVFLTINFFFHPEGKIAGLVRIFNLFFSLYSLFIFLYAVYLFYWAIFYLRVKKGVRG